MTGLAQGRELMFPALCVLDCRPFPDEKLPPFFTSLLRLHTALTLLPLFAFQCGDPFVEFDQ